MARQRSVEDGDRRVRSGTVVRAAQRMVTQIEELVADVDELRRENDALRAEVRSAVELFERASAAFGGGERRRGRESAPTRRRGPGRTRGPKGRATPPEVTVDVVRAVLAKLGEATASEIAAEITKAGAPVSGRAVRFIAERAGATTARGADGQRRYRVG